MPMIIYIWPWSIPQNLWVQLSWFRLWKCCVNT